MPTINGVISVCSSPATAHRLLKLLLLLTLCLTVLQGGPAITEAVVDTDGIGDFLNYYHAAVQFRHSESPYFSRQGHTPAIAPRILYWNPAWGKVRIEYNYPPTFGQALIPLTYFSPPTAKQVWTAFCLVAAGIVVWMLSTTAPRPQWLMVGSLALFWGLSRALVSELRHGQADLITLGFVVLSLVMTHRKHPVLAGGALALGFLTKVTPAVFVLYFLVRRDWRALVGFVGLTSVLLTISGLVFGFGHLLTYYRDILPQWGHTQDWFGNQTIAFFVQTAFRRVADRIPGFPASLGEPLSVIVRAAFLLAAVFAVYRVYARPSLRDARLRLISSWGLLAVVGLLISPVSWVFVYVWVVLGATVFVALALGPGRTWATPGFWAVFALGLAFTQNSFEFLLPVLRTLPAWSCMGGALMVFWSLWRILGALAREARSADHRLPQCKQCTPEVRNRGE